VLDRPVLPMLDPDHAVARGVALFALERHGDLDRGDLDRLAVTARRYEPTPEHRTVYDSMHEQFLASFDALRPIFEALNP
jgi:sugar (pentulose or hexulose) kinase